MSEIVSMARLDELGDLVAATEEEDIWVWNNGKKCLLFQTTSR
jgi:hypothetical protein